MGLQVGSVLAMRAVPDDPPPGASPAGQGQARPRLLRERVVGIVVTRGSVLPVTEQDKGPAILATQALFRQLGMRYVGYSGAVVKLRPGASPEVFRHRAQSLTRRFPATLGHVSVADENTQAAAVQHAIWPEAVALGLFALALGVTGLLIVGQAATRLLAAGSPDNPTLVALGMTRGQLMAAGLAEVGAAAAAGALAAAGVAVAASPLMPIGAARLAEPDPGVSADATVLAVGAATIVVLLVARVAWQAWRWCARKGGNPGPFPAHGSTLTAPTGLCNSGWPPGAWPAPVTWPRVRADRSRARHQRPACPWLAAPTRRTLQAREPGTAVAMAGHVPPPRHTRLRPHAKEVARVKQEQRPERAELQVLKDQDGRYYWRLQAASNRIIAWSGQAYDSKYWCVQDMNWLRATAHLIMVYDYTAEPPQDRHTPAGTANPDKGE